METLDLLGSAFQVATTVVQGSQGWRPAALAEDVEFVGALRGLCECPTNASPGGGEAFATNLEVVLNFEPVLLAAVGALGDNPRGLAAQLVCGLHTDTKGRIRKHRRPAAARAMDLDEDSFNRRYEKGIIDDLAVEIYRRLVFARPRQVQENGVSVS